MNKLPFTYFYFTFVLALFIITFPASHPANAQSFPGGFIEKANRDPNEPSAVRDRVTPADIPCPPGATPPCLPERGKFTFPAPYNTEGVRLTNASDCGGTDCVHAVGYSYWSNINNHVGSNEMLLFLGLKKTADGDGKGPTLFRYDKETDQVTKDGLLFADIPENARFNYSSGEGWYFSATQPTKLYLNDGPRMLRYDVIAKTSPAVVYDVSTQPQFGGTDKIIWQMHSSVDDKVHSATLRCVSIGCTDGVHIAAHEFEMMGCLVFREDQARFLYFPRTTDDPSTPGVEGAFDECQIDKSGRWLMIYEDAIDEDLQDTRDAHDNRIIDLQTEPPTEKILTDKSGGGGHPVLGYGYMVTHNNWDSLPSTIRLWSFDRAFDGSDPLQGSLVYHNMPRSDGTWVSSANHIAHSNAKSGVLPGQQYVCGSDTTRLNHQRSNEIICFRLDTFLDVLVVAPVMTDLDAPDGRTDYEKAPKGNLDVTGRYFIWTDNMAGDRLDAFVVKVPDQCLYRTPQHDGPCDSPVEEVEEVEEVVWTDLVNVTATGNSLQKTGGRHGCQDAGAISQQAITSGDGYVEFTASETTTTRGIGLSHGNTDVTGADIDFAIALWNDGLAYVYENGVYKFDTWPNMYATGDVFRVAVEGGTVKYYWNGALIYTSQQVPTYPLLVDTTLFDLDSTINNAVIARTPAVQDVVWTNSVNVIVNGNSLQESCGGCGDSGAQSSQIISGDGYLEFTATETTTMRAAGLGNGNTDNNYADIDFAILLWWNGIAEVRENGIYKWETTYTANERFRVAVEAGRVNYYKNGSLFYTSDTAPTYPLLVDTALHTSGCTVTDAVIAGAQ